jgi:hypothetical protein
MRCILQMFKLCRAQSQEASFESRLASNCVAVRPNTERQTIERGVMVEQSGNPFRQSSLPRLPLPRIKPASAPTRRGVNSEQVFLE